MADTHYKRRRSTYLFAFGLVMLVATASAAEQTARPAAKEPETKMEAFQARKGAVIIIGFSSIGSVRGVGEIAVESREFTEAGTGRKEFGVLMEVTQEGRIERKNSSYIDYDELDSLLKGIDFIAKLDKTVSKLDSFQAVYRTRAEFTVSVFNDSNGKLKAAVTSGRFGEANAYMPLDKLGEFKLLIQRAKDKLDSIRGEPK